MAITPTIPGTVNLQYIRTCTLLVATSSGSAVDLSQFRIVFSVKRTNAQTPNVADIKVFNLSSETALSLSSIKQYSRIVLQAGYQGNFGVIFAGTIKQTIIGRESATDTFIEFIAGDGDLAYNFAVVNTSIPAGSSFQNDVSVCSAAMANLGVTPSGNMTVPSTQKRSRGKVFFGQTRNYLRTITQSTGSSWSIQNEQLVFVPTNSYLPGTAVVLNSTTGMIGTPQQTLTGVNVKCLLNPNIQVSTRIQLNNASIQRLAINLSASNLPGIVSPALAAEAAKSQIPAPLSSDGVYYVSVIEHVGDTRGVEWYSNLVTLYVNPALPIQDAVSVGF